MPLKSGFYKIAHTENGVRKYLYSDPVGNVYDNRFTLRIGGPVGIQGVDANTIIYYIENTTEGLRIWIPRYN